MKHFKKGIATLIALLLISFSSFGQCEYLDSIESKYMSDYVSLDQAYADQYLQILSVSFNNGALSPCLEKIKKITLPKGDLFSPEIETFASHYSLNKRLLEYRNLVKQQNSLLVVTDSLQHQNGILTQINVKSNQEVSFLEKEYERLNQIAEFMQLVAVDYESGKMKKKCEFIFQYEFTNSTSLKEMKKIEKEYLDCQKE